MNTHQTDQLLQKLNAIERLARGSIAGRFLNNPRRYISAIGYWRLVYPLYKRGRFARARTFFGVEMEVILPSATEIFLFGAKTHDSEIRLARFLIKNLRPGDSFCDVGAHFGYFSLLASQLVGENGQVIAFEASHSTFGILKKNTAQATDVMALHQAASDENKTLVFNEFPALFSEYNSLVLPDVKNATWLKNNPPQRIEVPGQRLDDFFGLTKNTPGDGAISSNPVHLPAIIKIDVEGAELQVLRGMEQLMKKHGPTLVIEYLTGNSAHGATPELAPADQNETYRQVVAFVQSLGYRIFRIKNDGVLEPCRDLDAALRREGLSSDNVVFVRNATF